MEPISTLQFRRLLYDLQSNAPNNQIRIRSIGKMWQPNFLRIRKVTEKGAIFIDETVHEIIFVSNLSDVMQFEIEFRFREFQPHFHFDVNPSNE